MFLRNQCFVALLIANLFLYCRCPIVIDTACTRGKATLYTAQGSCPSSSDNCCQKTENGVVHPKCHCKLNGGLTLLAGCEVHNTETKKYKPCPDT